MTLDTYRNPTGECTSCRNDCCDDCSLGNTCDTVIVHCTGSRDDFVCDPFGDYFYSDTNYIQFDESLHAADNPIVLESDSPWNVSPLCCNA